MDLKAVDLKTSRQDFSDLVIALAGLTALAIAIGIGRFAFTPILPMMQADLGLSVVDGGRLATANYIGYLVGAVSALVIRIAPATAIRCALMVIGAATVAMAVTTHLAAWIALRACAGIASAWVLISVSTWSLEKLAHRHRPTLSSTPFAGVGLGIVIAGAVCLALLLAGGDSREAWIAMGICALLLTALIWTVFRAPAAVETAVVNASASRSAPWRAGAMTLVFCYGIFGFGYIIPATFIPAIARAYLADSLAFGWTWPVFGLAAAGSIFLAGSLLRICTARHLWIAGHLIMAAGIAVAAWSATLSAIFLAAVCVGGTFVVITMVGMREARAFGGGNGAGLMAAMTAAFATGQIAGPVLVGVTAGIGWSMKPMLWLASLSLAATALILWRTPRP